MATRIVGQEAGQPIPHASAAVLMPEPEAPREHFFCLSAKYTIDPAAEVHDLVSDAKSLIDCGISIVFADHDEMTEAQWGGFYLLGQAQAILNALNERFSAGLAVAVDAEGRAAQ